jgi:hypothetical protein
MAGMFLELVDECVRDGLGQRETSENWTIFLTNCVTACVKEK